MRSRAALAALLMFGLVACGSDEGPAEARPATTGDIKIVEPAPGQAFDGTSIPVKLSLTGATVLEKASTEITPDTGHIHVNLDSGGESKTLSLLAGLEFDLVELAGGEIPPGQHLLIVEFVAADHGFFAPREIEKLPFLVKR